MLFKQGQQLDECPYCFIWTVTDMLLELGQFEWKHSLNEKLIFIIGLRPAKHKEQSHTWPHTFKEKKKRKKCESVWVSWKLCNITLAFYCSSREALFFIRRHLTFRNLLGKPFVFGWDKDFLLTLLPSRIFLQTVIF